MDRRGSGLNFRDRGDVDRYRTWLTDIESYLESLTPSLPVVLCGISWGGKLAAAVARHRPELLTGFGMLCPGIFAKQIPGPAKYAALNVAGAIGLKQRRVTIPLQDPALFTASPTWQSYINQDALTLRKITIRFAMADRELTEYASEAPDEIKVPALLALSGRDKIVDNPRTRQYFEALGSSDKKTARLPGRGTHFGIRTRRSAASTLR